MSITKTCLLELLTVMLLLTASYPAFAVPAKPTPITITQPDGSQLTVRLRGDEFRHFYTTLDGYLIQKGADGCFRYSSIGANGDLSVSDMRVQNVGQRGDSEKAFLSSIDSEKMYAALRNQPVTGLSKLRARVQSSSGSTIKKFPKSGNIRSLVILVQYKDVKFTTSDPYTAFSDLLNKEGYAYNNGTGSVRDYFVDNSSGKFKPQFDVFGPVTLANNMSYYGGNDANDQDKAPEEMVIEACKQLDASIDFSQYDTDNDGWVDNIYVFYAGYGEADGGSPDTVWPHAWNVYSGARVTLILDGKQIGSYSCSNEIDGQTSALTGIGTFTHEFCHVLGLPDLYSTSYNDLAFTPGSWSILDYGPYNNNGKTPPYMTVYERYSLGWIAPAELTGAKTISLKDVSQNDGYIIKTDKDNEYFLLENRQQKGSDKYIPGHGMLVWHIDYNQAIWSNNVVNDTPSHQYVDIEEADGTKTDASRAGDAFPGTSNKAVFADTSTPSMKTWAGVSLNKPITNISESNGLISFDFMGGDSFQAVPVATPATNIGPTTFTANWEAFAGASSYELDVYQLDANSQKLYLSGFQAKNTGNVLSFNVVGLQPATQYYFVVRGATQYAASASSNAIAVTTGNPTFDLLLPVAIAATDTTSTSFTANWKALAGATGYFLDVYKKTAGKQLSTNIAFTNSLADLPSGWESTATSFYTITSSGYFGKLAPALKLDNNGQYIKSQVYDSEITSLSFWYRGASASTSNSLTLQAYDGVTWKDLKVIQPITNASAGQTLTMAATELKGAYALKWVYSKSSGNLALDDIAITSGNASTVISIPEYTQKDVQNVLSYNVTGLDPDTEYYYTISATNGVLTSAKSNEIVLKTKSSNSDIHGIGADTQISVLPDAVVIRSSSSTGKQVVVYNLAGQTVFSATTNGELRIPRAGLQKGAYFVKVGKNTWKLAL